MYMNEDEKATITAWREEDAGIRERARQENRVLTATEASRIVVLYDQIESFKLNASVSEPNRPDPGDSPSGLVNGGNGSAIRGATPRSFKAMFPKANHSDNGGFDSFADFVRASSVARSTGSTDPRLLKISAALVEGTPSSGGFLVPIQHAGDIFSASLEQEVIRPGAEIWPMRGSTLDIPATVIGDHSSNLFGGAIGTWTAESGSITQAEPQYRQIELNANKLAIFGKISNELLFDANAPANWLEGNCAQVLSWYLDDAFISGNGVARPSGIIGSAATITVSAEVGQVAASIVYENLANMLANLYAGSWEEAVWICHPSTIPQLLTLGITVGVGGSHVPVLNESNGKMTLLSRPVLFSEKCSTLGTAGDVIRADRSQYAIGIRADMRFDMSQGPAFQTDEASYRMVLRVDGASKWSGPLTLKDGSSQSSPFVILETRT